ncbi:MULTISPECIES: hypothetical protein [Halomonadaceae]|jgi:hypothetical protein|nr:MULTISPECIES: hypothetical protein [unclassified Halomonas]MBL1270246.1 hypothetical protein [Halomonas sp.]PKG54509.1 hypothetical protein CXF87_02860 [Halomonas sp. MES3-P3E]|tara:strand:+ start:823 stop:1281 length:459 start_codon:yes stop_codon:yes gene_type:complete
MTQSNEHWLASLGRVLTGRRKQSVEANRIDPSDPAITKMTISLALDLLNEDRSHERFSPRDRVSWKWGMKNKSVPLARQTAVVLKVRQDPITDSTQSPSSTYYEEPLDVLVGMYTHEGIFRELWIDGRRLCLLTDQRLNSPNDGSYGAQGEE